MRYANYKKKENALITIHRKYFPYGGLYYASVRPLPYCNKQPCMFHWIDDGIFQPLAAIRDQLEESEWLRGTVALMLSFGGIIHNCVSLCYIVFVS